MLEGAVAELPVMNDEHRALVERAERWLRNSAVVKSDGYLGRFNVKCGIVLTERHSQCEIPDAIGWVHQGRLSIVVECKTSRGDFLADAKKPHRRRPQSGMGRYRYFMARPGLLSVEELPPLWGLIEASGSRCKVLRLAEQQAEWDRVSEMGMLYSELRRKELGIE